MKNGEEFGVLKRYNPVCWDSTGADMVEAPKGAWVRFYDYDNLARRKELIHRKLITTLTRERALYRKIKELEQEIELYKKQFP